MTNGSRKLVSISLPMSHWLGASICVAIRVEGLIDLFDGPGIACLDARSMPLAELAVSLFFS